MISYRIGFDLDNVLNNLTAVMLEHYNLENNTSYTIDQIIHYDLYQCFPPEIAKDMLKLLDNSAVIESMSLTPKAYDVLAKLAKAHEVFIVTATHFQAVPRKVQWVLEHLPCIDTDHILITPNKQLLNLDVLVDDNPQFFYGGLYTRILYDQPWNQDTHAFECRVSSMLEALQIIDGLENCHV